MTRTQKLQIEQSEVRQKIGEAIDQPADDRADTFQADLDTLTRRAQALEVELRAALVVGDDTIGETETETDETPEAAELRELESRASIGPIFEAALGGALTDGAERELQDHLGLAGNQIPLALLRREDGPELETRAVTPAPTDVGKQQAAIISAAFPRSAADWLGIPMPTVARRRGRLSGADHGRDRGDPGRRRERGRNDRRIQR